VLELELLFKLKVIMVIVLAKAELQGKYTHDQPNRLQFVRIRREVGVPVQNSSASNGL
jgi:hypothetical protein